MKDQFESRFEEELEKIKVALSKKGGTKKIERVHQRIGRAREKYPSVHNRYEITTINDKSNKHVIDLQWKKDRSTDQQKNGMSGKIFLRTSMDMVDEAINWIVYNTIREVESTFRTLKTDLDLRPMYHKSDEDTLAHLNLGLLSYWLVNTIRCQLKSSGIRHSWKEIVRIGNTQKVITTTGYNKSNEEIKVMKYSQPTQKLKELQLALTIKQKPYTKLKSVVHRLKSKNETI